MHDNVQFAEVALRDPGCHAALVAAKVTVAFEPEDDARPYAAGSQNGIEYSHLRLVIS